MHAEVIGGLNSIIIDTDHTQKWHNRLARVNVKGYKFVNDNNVFGKDQCLTCHFMIIVCLVPIVGCRLHLVHTRHLEC